MLETQIEKNLRALRKDAQEEIRHGDKIYAAAHRAWNHANAIISTRGLPTTSEDNFLEKKVPDVSFTSKEGVVTLRLIASNTSPDATKFSDVSCWTIRGGGTIHQKIFTLTKDEATIHGELVRKNPDALLPVEKILSFIEQQSRPHSTK